MAFVINSLTSISPSSITLRGRPHSLSTAAAWSRAHGIAVGSGANSRSSCGGRRHQHRSRSRCACHSGMSCGPISQAGALLSYVARTAATRGHGPPRFAPEVRHDGQARP